MVEATRSDYVALPLSSASRVDRTRVPQRLFIALFHSDIRRFVSQRSRRPLQSNFSRLLHSDACRLFCSDPRGMFLSDPRRFLRSDPCRLFLSDHRRLFLSDPRCSAIQSYTLKEQQTAFYNDIQSMTNIEAAARFTEVTKREMHSEGYSDVGEWLPLSVWSSRGFDASIIMAKARQEDRKPCQMFGELFRVNVHTDVHRGERTVEKTDKMLVRRSLGNGA